MKRRCIPSLFLLACACAAIWPGSALAVKNGSVTVYNSGRALVTETRTVQLPGGPASVVVKGTPATIDPTSVEATAEGMTVLGLQYRAAAITERALLDRFIGKELSVVLPNPSEEGRILRKATLLANQGKPVFLLGEEIYVGDYEAILLPELPIGLQQEPTLTLTTDNDGEAQRDIRLRYLMGGLTWSAHYALTLDRAGTVGRLDGAATIANASGVAFEGANVRLVAGDVQRVHAPQPRMKAAVMTMEADMAAPSQPQRESFSQHHLYTLNRPVDLQTSGTSQFTLLQADAVTIRQELVSSSHVGAGQRRGTTPQPVASLLRFNNAEADGLGQPMPAGLVRVFMPAADGETLLAGEASIGHVGVGDEAVLTLGRAFDVSVERTQTDFRKLGKNSVETSWRIDVINGRDKPQSLRLTERFPGEWTIVGADAPYQRVDASAIEFQLDAPPTPDGAPFSIAYTVQITYY